jgi:molybdopterin-guanine dinucleotide biosynthesis protein A
MPPEMAMSARQTKKGRPRTKDRVGVPVRWTIWILAGGRSSRMGRDKSRIIVAGRTLLQRVRSAAAATGLPVRTIRTDSVPRCGPLGGILTGLKRARSGWCLFIGCDMPLLTARLIGELRDRAAACNRPVFVRTRAGYGFPLALPVVAGPAVIEVIAGGRPTLQRLAGKVNAVSWRVRKPDLARLKNVNTPADLEMVRRTLVPA